MKWRARIGYSARCNGTLYVVNAAEIYKNNAPNVFGSRSQFLNCEPCVTPIGIHKCCCTCFLVEMDEAGDQGPGFESSPTTISDTKLGSFLLHLNKDTDACVQGGGTVIPGLCVWQGITTANGSWMRLRTDPASSSSLAAQPFLYLDVHLVADDGIESVDATYLCSRWTCHGGQFNLDYGSVVDSTSGSLVLPSPIRVVGQQCEKPLCCCNCFVADLPLEHGDFINPFLSSSSSSSSSQCFLQLSAEFITLVTYGDCGVTRANINADGYGCRWDNLFGAGQGMTLKWFGWYWELTVTIDDATETYRALSSDFSCNGGTLTSIGSYAGDCPEFFPSSITLTRVECDYRIPCKGGCNYVASTASEVTHNYTSPGTHTINITETGSIGPSGTGGGGGGGANGDLTLGAQGGGHGGSSSANVYPVFPGDVVTIIVGSGGFGGNNGFGIDTSGSDGGDTQIKVNGSLIMTAGGGEGGLGGGSGASPKTGSGGFGVFSDGTLGTGSSGQLPSGANGGNGGSPGGGTGGQPEVTPGAGLSNGGDGTLPGGGGGGAGGFGQGADSDGYGGTGAPGSAQVVVRTYTWGYYDDFCSPSYAAPRPTCGCPSPTYMTTRYGVPTTSADAVTADCVSPARI